MPQQKQWRFLGFRRGEITRKKVKRTIFYWNIVPPGFMSWFRGDTQLRNANTMIDVAIPKCRNLQAAEFVSQSNRLSQSACVGKA